LKKIFTFHWPGIAWIAGILVLTWIPGSLIPEIPSFLDLFKPDKLVHLFLFAVLVPLLLRGLDKQWITGNGYRLAVPVALNIGILVGGITELLQATTLITGRQCSVYDFIANVAGCFLGWGIFVLWKRKRSKE
jgi:VanZ family protein